MESAGSINLKPNKAESYEGKRDYLVVNTWLYKVEQYLTLIQLSNPGITLSDENRIMYASTFLTGTAAVWWYTLVQGNQIPASWNDFKAAVVKEFVPEDHIRRSRDKLRKLKQVSSVSKYLSEFRNIVLTIPDITDGEKWDKFCAGLKYEIGLEVMKFNVSTFEEAAHIALRVDSALWGANAGRSQQQGSSSNDSPTPMEIGNMEKRPTAQRLDAQRLKDLRNNACFSCHKVGCRPWKHNQRNQKVSNVIVDDVDSDDRTEEDGDHTREEN